MTVAYVMSTYPALSNTFIQREITALEGCDTSSGPLEVLRLSVNTPTAQDLLTEIHQQESVKTTYLKGQSRLAWVSLAARALLRLRGRYVSAGFLAMRDGGGDLRQVLWRIFYFAEATAVWDASRSRGVRHIHAHFGQGTANVAWFAAELLRADRLVTNDVTWSFTIHGWLEFLNEEADSMRAKIEAADLTLCISDHTRSQAMRIAPPAVWDRIVLQRCGVDLNRFAFQPDRSANSASVPTVLTVARLAPEKGHVVLFEAIALLASSGRRVQLNLAGSGPFREELQRHVERLDITDDVVFLGPVGQDEIPQLLVESSVFCLPSFSEGVPVSLMESMAVGTPVVATAINGIPELVVDGETGRLVVAARPDDLADAIWSLVSDQHLRSQVVHKARKHVEAHFDAATNGRRLAALFDDCIQSRHTDSREPVARENLL